ncbi:MAG: hypothetical protein ED556_08090 [Winogradskyella sp.]|uniref:DUF6702 family protein n=1 Tax=Winogradskyella sp. TaxID=1883156 RepID=UPI000F40883B|nr:DUF6702 family protein [Winogradskyella sp.]RNC86249.1 MAG: hypothetical protein ED556_08090 [Winogradskyella sp.]
MKPKLFFSFLLLSAFLFASLSSHPLKLTASEIKYDEKTKSIRVDCRVFIDDFAPVINKTLFDRLENSNITEDDKLAIQNYFAFNYRISINGKVLPFKIKDYKVQSNVMNIEFAKNYITLKKGDKLYIENNLLFEVFGPMQTNWVTLRIPPFIPKGSFESQIESNSYSQTF